MTDKLKSTLMNLPEFAAGELPTSGKLNASFEQINYALQRLEKSLGDLTDHDSQNKVLSADKLHQHTLGRNVGANNLANSRVDSKTNFVFSETLGLGRNEWFLPVIPRGTDEVLNYSVSFGTATSRLGVSVFQTDVTPNIPSNTGEYYFDTANNKLVSFLTLFGGTATFICTSHIDAEKTNNVFFSAGLGSETLNVIPPRHIGATSISVSTSSNVSYDYIVSISPFVPQYQSPLSDTDLTRKNQVALEAIGEVRKGHYGVNSFKLTTDALSFKLPRTLSTYAEGDQIPNGHLYLYDEGNDNTILDGTYFKRDDTSVYYRGVSLNTAATSQYRIINHGGISQNELLESLRFDMKHHEHKGPRAINHDSLSNLGQKVNTSLGLAVGRGWYRTTVPTHHPHPQYLNRYGWDEGYDTANLSNLMLGHIYLAASSTNMEAQTYTDALGTSNSLSYGLYFGNQNHRIITTRPSTDELNYLSVRAPGLEIANTPGVLMLGSSTNFLSIHAGGIQTAFSTEATDVLVVGVGSLNTLANNARNVFYDTVSDGAFLDVLSNSANVRISGVVKDSDVNVAGCEDVQISIVGSINATMINETGIAYDFVTNSYSSANASPPFSGRGKYAFYDNYRIDAPRRRTKVYNPTKWIMLETDTAEGFAEMDYIASANIPKFRIRSTAANNNGFAIAGDTYDAATYLDLPDDAYVQQINLGLTYQVATLKLYQVRLDGSAIEIASTSLPNMNGSSTTISWVLNTAHGVSGERYPTAQNTAIDLLLVVENAATTPAGTNMIVHMGQSIFYEMRS